MTDTVTDELVGKLASLAGHEFAPDRCALLAPQLEWLLAEGAPIRDLPLADVEPLNVFRPGDALNPSAQEDGHA